ncbi:MAG: phosphoenolpyruvate--protein phosphotransferase [Deltaproteobacteria bacterium]|nr:phosphoenolpyruvate--protein phosphotransferase [Deltaproteobacteria bacterium]
MKLKKTTHQLKGIGTSPGIYIGAAYLIKKPDLILPRYWINNKEINNEVQRFLEALEKTSEEIEKIQEKLCKFEGRQQINILDTYHLILQDKMLRDNTVQYIKTDHINAEWALHKTTKKIRKSIPETHTPQLQEKTSDFNDIKERIIRQLLGKNEEIYGHLPKHSIVVAHDLSPAETSQLIKFNIKGIITEVGGITSHTAIISRALEIPCVVACQHALTHIKTGNTIIVDGAKGNVIIHPSKQQTENFKQHQNYHLELKKIFLKETHLPAETKDKHRIHLTANMELMEELQSIKENGAEGIGLYRTEFTYINRKDLPNEEELFKNYQHTLKSIYPYSVTIRTLDIGGDKVLKNYPYEKETNPALGLRAIRFCLREKAIFKTQLRAMLRASLYGKLKILFPLICELEEIQRAKKILNEVKDELRREKIEFDDNAKIGIMIEVPSSVMIAEELAQEVDFFSIGTNDLIQYSLAIDRSNENVTYLYRPLHPAILRMLKISLAAAKKYKININVCGEMASDPLYIMFLVGMGFRELSMNALSIPRAKRMIRMMTYSQAKNLLSEAMHLKTAYEIESYAKRHLEKIFGKELDIFDS